VDRSHHSYRGPISGPFESNRGCRLQSKKMIQKSVLWQLKHVKTISSSSALHSSYSSSGSSTHHGFEWRRCSGAVQWSDPVLTWIQKSYSQYYPLVIIINWWISIINWDNNGIYYCENWDY
jgi:hypothetical protein